MYTPEGISSVANFITACEESQKDRPSRFLIRNVFFFFVFFLFPKAIFLTFLHKHWGESYNLKASITTATDSVLGPVVQS